MDIEFSDIFINLFVGFTFGYFLARGVALIIRKFLLKNRGDIDKDNNLPF